MYFIRKTKSIAATFNHVEGGYWTNVGGAALTDLYPAHSSGNGGVTILGTETGSHNLPGNKRLIVGKRAATFRRFAQQHVQLLDGVGRVKQPTLFGMMVLTVLLTALMTTALLD